MPLPILKEVGRAKVTFDGYKNEAVARTPFLSVYGKRLLDGISISARFASQGKKVTKPESIILRFTTSAKDRTYIDNRAIRIFSGKKQVLDSTGKLVSTINKVAPIYATVEQEIPYELFVKLSKSKKIKMQVGPTEFDLSKSDIEAFRDLLKTIED